jgi:polyphosphate kinase 2 (PPK2 family)
MNYYKKFCVNPGSTVDLGKVDASFKDKQESHEHALPEIETYARKLHDLQCLMYAEGKRSLLICLQGRDAAGKDGTINHVLAAMNPQGCRLPASRCPPRKRRPTIFVALSPAYAGQRTGGDI